MRLREVFGIAKNLGIFRRKIPLNRAVRRTERSESPQGVARSADEAEHRRVNLEFVDGGKACAIF